MFRRFMLAGLLVLLASSLAWAVSPDDGPAVPTPGPDPENVALPDRPTELPGLLAADPETLSPMLREIVELWKAQDVAMAALNAGLEKSVDHAAALALQRQVENLRTSTEIQILRIQARYARQEGRMDVAVQIEQDIAQLTAPRTRGVPVDRPAPDSQER